MSDIFTNLPVPVGANGSGASVDTSGCGASKYIICDGTWTLPDRPPTVNVEMSNEASPTGWSPLCTFVGNGAKKIDCAANWMRVTISNYRGGTNPEVNFGSTDDVATFENLPVTAGVGTGAAVDISALGEIKTLQIVGPFTGAVIMEYSEDAGGVDWAELPAMYAPGSQTMPLIAMWARIRRQGIPVAGTPGTPICNLGGVSPSGGGGSSIFTRVTVQDLRLSPALTPAVITGTNNNYNPTGFSAYTRIRQENDDGVTTITGLAAQDDGELRLLENLGPNPLVISHESASSTAANRVTCPGGSDLTVLANGAILFVYDGITSRWFIDAVSGVDNGTLASLRLTPAQSPAALAAGSTNDYAPAGLSTTTIFRLTPDAGAAGSTLTGLVAQSTGSIRVLENLGVRSLTLAHEDAGSAAANRFTCPGGTALEILTGGAAWAIYDGTTSRWRIIATSGEVANPAFQNFLITPAGAPAALGAGATNDYNPTGLSNTARWRLSTNAAGSTLNGLVAQTTGSLRWLENIGTGNLTFANENTGSTAANRFTCPGGYDLVVKPGGAAAVFYDAVTSRWLVGATAGAEEPAGGTAQTLAANAAIVNVEARVVAYAAAANELKVGTTFRVSAYCTQTGAGVGAPRFRVRVGPVTLTGTIAAGGAMVNLGGDGFWAEFTATVTIRTVGAGGTVTGAVGQYNFGGNNIVINAGTVAVDTTVANFIEVTADSNDAANTLTFRDASITKIR